MATARVKGTYPRKYVEVSGGGGGGDHATLTNRAWVASLHTGTASRFAVFDSGGAAAYLAYPTSGVTTWTGTAFSNATISAPLTFSANTLAITAADGSHNGYLSSIDWTAFNAKEPAITATTSADYYRGDKTFQPLNKAAVGLGNVENTALSTWPGSTNVTTLGTVTTCVWNATAIGPTYGGTGLTTYTTGDLVYASATNTLSKLAIGGSAYFLGSNGTTPGWRQPSDVRSDLGLVIGTNVQAYDAGLTSLAAADASAGLPYVSGANTWATATYTAMLSVVSGAWKVIGWRESGGTDLTNGALADGQLMARVGTAVAGVDVGATPAASKVVKSGSDGYIDRGWLPTGKYPFADPTKFLYYYWTVSAGSMIYNGPTPTTAGSSVVFSDTTSGIQFTSTGTAVFSGWNTGTTNATTRLGHNGTTSYLIQMSSDLTNQRMRIGLYTGTPGNNDTPGASGYYLLFRYSTSAGDTKWQIVHGTSTGYTVTDTGVTVTASKTYLFTLTTSSSGVTYTVLEDPHGAAANTYTGTVTSNNPTSSTNIGLTAYIVSTTASSHNYVFYGALYQAAQP